MSYLLLPLRHQSVLKHSGLWPVATRCAPCPVSYASVYNPHSPPSLPLSRQAVLSSVRTIITQQNHKISIVLLDCNFP